MFKKSTNAPSCLHPTLKTSPKPKSYGLLLWLWRWMMAVLLVLVISFHLLIVAKQAAVVSEDAKFATHNGFDVDGIERAIKVNEASGRVGVGGSTISQQLAKNLFLTSHRSYIRKGEEAVITVMMEGMWDKQRILEVYLNVAEFGEGIYGIEAAAQHYYGKKKKNLSREQSALLISMLPNPKYYQKNLNNRRLQNKKRIIMKRMPSAVLP